jgi:hypothetical protein
MKIPINCPFCKEPLINNYEQSFLNIYCNNIDHNILFRPSIFDHDEVHFMSIDYDVNKDRDISRIIWYFWGKTLLGRANSKYYELPWFEPDLSNYLKLCNKIKLYMIFQ